MDSWFEQNKKPLVQATILFAVLFGSVILMARFYDFSNIDMGGLLFLSASLSCIFIAKNTFDNVRSNSNSEIIKRSMSSDLEVSSEELYIQLYKNSPVPYLIVDFEGFIKSANISAIRILGESQAKVKGENIFSRLQCDEVDHLDLIIEKYKNGIAVRDELVQVLRQDKSETWALLSLFSFSDTTGQLIGILTLVDITKQKKSEDAKSEFVSLASHQLRTPIAGMKWSAELLLMDNPESLSDNQHKYIDRLLDSIQRMGFLVDDFLKVSRFELGTFQPEYKDTIVSDLFNDIIEEQSTKVIQKKLVIKKSFDESVSSIVTDPSLIRMIVTNLYTNATKYTRNKGTIHIGYIKKDSSLVITVADNGMGIPEGDQAEIFSKLFRASNAVRNVPDGTGLGLYIVREAVTVLKGQINFTTTENVGTTFEVVLPL